MSIEKVVKQAIRTFTKPQSKAIFQENLDELMNQVNKIKITDLYLDHDFVQREDSDSALGNPLLYVQIYKDNNISVSVFILKKYSKIPLHDHPLMHGIIKVISGNLKIQSYSLEDTSHIKEKGDENFVCIPNDRYYVDNNMLLYDSMGTRVLRHSPKVLTENDSCALLTPTKYNIHAVESHGGPSAFLDILAPPYNTAFGRFTRQCSYFNLLETQTRSKPLLAKSIFPPDYFTIDVDYRGPPIEDSFTSDS